jgi:hypothetical protein
VQEEGQRQVEEDEREEEHPEAIEERLTTIYGVQKSLSQE